MKQYFPNTAKDLPIEDDGGTKELFVSDLDLPSMLSQMIRQLKIISFQLALITDTIITEKEVY